MAQGINVFAENISNQEKANEVIGRLFEVAKPEQAFSTPVNQGDYAVLTAAEVSISMGLGYGGGGGGGGAGTDPEKEEVETGQGFGVGGGGGGLASSRPIAAIEIGPRGVVVEPIVDVTKISLALITAVGSMGLMLLKMKNSGN